jgi:hypothetical protein
LCFEAFYYHLKYPLLAFECIAQALKFGGQLYFEGKGLIDYAEDLDSLPVEVSTGQQLGALNASVGMTNATAQRKD